MKRERKIGHKEPESYRNIFRILIGTIVPVLLSTTIYNLVSIVDQWLFKNIATMQGYSATNVSEWWGIFSGKYPCSDQCADFNLYGVGSFLCSGTGSSFRSER